MKVHQHTLNKQFPLPSIPHVYVRDIRQSPKIIFEIIKSWLRIRLSRKGTTDVPSSDFFSAQTQRSVLITPLTFFLLTSATFTVCALIRTSSFFSKYHLFFTEAHLSGASESNLYWVCSVLLYAYPQFGSRAGHFVYASNITIVSPT